ncbi:DNA polymerase III subunit delta [Phorcysia thermohydrogeniphila]|uniref:DNA-directed DNA polymerase n=1 Tax=Phorcysia thermohydrogeniphila TaxID=936138 RepID=A0A4R1GFK2_9BACT|nr:DNA polymerase III subunit delta [Phorcysia thermohydrogeniphila]TCK04609.1 DNA polymerase III delta subunit [Phorcysia thermohydrogeniphila]
MKTVKAYEVLKKVKDKLPWNKVLIYGEESYLTQQFLKKIGAIRQLEKFHADEELGSFLNFTGTSLFGDSPIPVLLGVEKLTELLRKKADKERFIKFLKSLDSFILVSYEELDYRKLKSEVFSAIGQIVDIVIHSENYPEEKIYALLAKKFRLEGREVSRELLKLIVEIVGTDLRELRNETEKLLLYPGELTPEVVKLLLFSSGKANVFELIFPLVEGSRREYLNQLEELLQKGADPLSLIALLQTQLRQLISMATGDKVRLPPDTIKKLRALLKQRSYIELLLLLKKLHEKEFAVKRGIISGEEALKSLAFEL